MMWPWSECRHARSGDYKIVWLYMVFSVAPLYALLFMNVSRLLQSYVINLKYCTMMGIWRQIHCSNSSIQYGHHVTDIRVVPAAIRGVSRTLVLRGGIWGHRQMFGLQTLAVTRKRPYWTFFWQILRTMFLKSEGLDPPFPPWVRHWQPLCKAIM